MKSSPIILGDLSSKLAFILWSFIIVRSNISIATVSENLRHYPSAICAHLDPVITEILKLTPTLKSAHFLGKGAPDGVRASVKRATDNAVAYGSDISDFGILINKLSNEQSNIKVICIPILNLNIK